MAQFTMPNIGINDEKRVSLNNFRGVDYSTSKLSVSYSRATNMYNVIYRDRNNQKRFGYEALCMFNDNQPINGYWQFIDSYNHEIHRIVHVGEKLYKITLGNRIDEAEKKVLDVTFKPSFYDEDTWKSYIKVKNQKSFGVVRGNRLYIFCGTFLVFGSWDDGKTWELRAVRDNEDTYIPTTTTNILPLQSEIISSQASLDEVNMLSSRRKNVLLYDGLSTTYLEEYHPSNPGAAFADKVWKAFNVANFKTTSTLLVCEFSTESFSGKFSIPLTEDFNRTLSSIPTLKSICNYYDDLGSLLQEISIRIVYEDGVLNINNFIVGTSDNNLDFVASVSLKEIPVYQLDGYPICKDAAFRPIVKYGDKTINFNEDGFSIDENGLRTNEFIIDYETGKLTIVTPLINDSEKLEVEFTTQKYIDDKAYMKIDNCQFGVIFGYGGVEHLFVSGNEDFPNMDWHTSELFSQEQALKRSENFTYFSDLSYNIVGGEQNKITGYSLLEDNYLGIHKSESTNEPSFYVRRASLVDARNSLGEVITDVAGNVYKKIEYLQYTSSIGEGCVSSFTTANLVGDKLFLSKNGVFGLVLTENYNSLQRYARSRSTLINSRLVTEDLKNCSSIVHDGKYYLYVGGEKQRVYVAESRFKNQIADELTGTFGYEWYVLENIDARIWFIDENDELWFGTSKGELCKFMKDTFADVTYERTMLSLASAGESNLYFNYNSNQIQDGTRLIFTSDSNLYEEIISKDDITQLFTDHFNISFDCYYDKARYVDQQIIYIDEINYTLDVKVNTPYKIEVKKVDEDYCIYLYREDGSQVTYENDFYFFRVSKKVTEARAYIEDEKLYLESYVFSEDETPSPKKIISYNGIYPTAIESHVMHYDNVVLHWTFPILQFEPFDYRKTIKYICVTFEPVINGAVDIYYSTNRKDGEFTTKKIKKMGMEGVDAYSFEDEVDYSRFTYELSSDAKIFTKKLRVRNFNFVTFWYYSNNDKNCLINSFEIVYTISKRNGRIG